MDDGSVWEVVCEWDRTYSALIAFLTPIADLILALVIALQLHSRKPLVAATMRATYIVIRTVVSPISTDSLHLFGLILCFVVSIPQV